MADTLLRPGKAAPHFGAGPDVPLGDCVLPAQMGQDAAADAFKKTGFGTAPLFLRSFLCTPFLGFAVALTAHLTDQGMPSGSAGLFFPVGYIMLWVLGFEMVTGSFSIMAIGVCARTVRLWALVRNWILTYMGNLAGGVFFAFLLWFSLTKGGNQEASGLLSVIAHIAEKKIAYRHFGASGWCAAVGMGILCNWLVSLAPILSKGARSAAGKIILIWLPLATFFSVGFEHAVVNMFVFPVALLCGAEVNFHDWWFWNQIPVTTGNIIGAVIFNGILWYKSHEKAAKG
ncbi:formate/nitrite transporter family protein [Kordiimonas lipolytica]|uniref:Formate/nitrite transporter family protein n=1 Tax=Kordiimonas lipolytica TaxID=1662421 RepID=A0ABV8U7S8_9PROT|nr:formate/nitrite transporter family protein [Kordiimonas lipolytica]